MQDAGGQPPVQVARLEPAIDQRQRASVFVPGATLDGWNWSRPLPAFHIDLHPVSNQEFLAFVRTHPQWKKSRIAQDLHDGDYLKHWEGDEGIKATEMDLPVRYVSYHAASAYCQSFGKALPDLNEYRAASNAPHEKIFVKHDTPYKPPQFHFHQKEWTTYTWVMASNSGRVVYAYGSLHKSSDPLTPERYTGRALGFRCVKR